MQDNQVARLALQFASIKAYALSENVSFLWNIRKKEWFPAPC